MSFSIKHNHVNQIQSVHQLGSYCTGIFFSSADFVPFCLSRKKKKKCFGDIQVESEIIVSTVTAGRCQKSGHIRCTAQLGCCRAASTKFKMLHTHTINCFDCGPTPDFSISTFEPFMAKVTQNSCFTHIIRPRQAQ